MTDLDIIWEEDFMETKQNYIEPDDLGKLENKEVNILSHNIRSLSKNGDKLKSMLLKAANIDAIFLQEVWAPKCPTAIKGYKLEILKRTNQRGGGLGAYLKDDTEYRILCEKIKRNWEIQIISIKSKKTVQK